MKDIIERIKDYVGPDERSIEETEGSIKFLSDHSMTDMDMSVEIYPKVGRFDISYSWCVFYNDDTFDELRDYIKLEFEAAIAQFLYENCGVKPDHYCTDEFEYSFEGLPLEANYVDTILSAFSDVHSHLQDRNVIDQDKYLENGFANFPEIREAYKETLQKLIEKVS